MKKTIFFLTLCFSFALAYSNALAYTEAECNSRGGTCQSADCGNSGNTIGTCWESGNANFNRINCCGNASQAQQNTSGSGGGNQASGFGNPIGESTIEGVLGRIMGYLKGIAGTIAVIFIIIGGIMYMISAGNKDMAER